MFDVDCNSLDLVLDDFLDLAAEPICSRLNRQHTGHHIAQSLLRSEELGEDSGDGGARSQAEGLLRVKELEQAFECCWIAPREIWHLRQPMLGRL